MLHLAEGTRFLPQDPWHRAQVVRWLCFESGYVQSSVATLRHWIMTGKAARRDPAAVDARRVASTKMLGMLERHLTGRDFLVPDHLDEVFPYAIDPNSSRELP